MEEDKNYNFHFEYLNGQSGDIQEIKNYEYMINNHMLLVEKDECKYLINLKNITYIKIEEDSKCMK